MTQDQQQSYKALANQPELTLLGVEFRLIEGSFPLSDPTIGIDLSNLGSLAGPLTSSKSTKSISFSSLSGICTNKARIIRPRSLTWVLRKSISFFSSSFDSIIDTIEEGTWLIQMSADPEAKLVKPPIVTVLLAPVPAEATEITDVLKAAPVAANKAKVVFASSAQTRSSVKAEPHENVGEAAAPPKKGGQHEKFSRSRQSKRSACCHTRNVTSSF